MRAPASGREALVRADPGGVYVDRETGEELRPVTRVLPLEPSASELLRTPDFYRPLVDHPNVLRVVALSGGYSREESCSRLAANRGVVASFSRALTEGLSAQQSDDEFDAMLDEAIGSIYEASIS